MARKWFSKQPAMEADDLPRRYSNRGEEKNNKNESVAAIRSQSTFRRNRTLTGSVSSRVASGNELYAEFQSPRAKVHHLARVRRQLGLLFAIVCLAGVALYLVVSQLIAHVQISVSDNVVLDETTKRAYIAQLDKYYASRPLERLLPLLKKEELYSFMTSEYAEIKTLDIQATGEPGYGTVRLTLRKPVASWSLAGKNEFVDENGIVFKYNAYSTPSMQIIDSNRSATANADNLVTSNRFLGFVGKIVGAAKQQGYTVTKVTIPPFTTRQLEADVEGVPYKIKLTLDKPAGEQMEDMGRVIRYITKQQANPKYIDVRVKGRAFYQ